MIHVNTPVYYLLAVGLFQEIVDQLETDSIVYFYLT